MAIQYGRCPDCIKKEKIEVSGTVDEFNRRMLTNVLKED